MASHCVWSGLCLSWSDSHHISSRALLNKGASYGSQEEDHVLIVCRGRDGAGGFLWRWRSDRGGG
ncbi:hypothetical protein ACFFX0_21000 [Citricoccus parietis]|uniref:Uncharacterized protein n=1 Tax=Citricoccus parietis TaxID=592307 RepID=A0ABV5G3Q2_9MICC